MRVAALTATALTGLLLAGCAASPAAAPPGGTATPPVVPAAEILARHGLAGDNARQVIDALDATNDDRSSGLVGSVRPNELVLSDAQGQASLPLPSDAFYLSIAPYLTKTHDCFNHNLSSCQGELAQKAVHVTVTDASGAAVLNSDVVTYPNGFAGLWLPKGMTGKLTVAYDGKTATSAIGTGPDDPTCLTTLKLQ